MSDINKEILERIEDKVNIVSVPSIFSLHKVFKNIDYGKTILELVKDEQPNEDMWENINVYINDTYIEQNKWYLVRPKIGTIVRIFATPTGGGGEGGSKDVIRLVAIIALIVVAPYLVGLIPGIGAVGTASYTLAYMTVVLAGSALINKLIPITKPKLDILTPDDIESPSQFLQGARNRLNPFGVVPRVFGKHRMSPPFAALPYTEVRGDDQYLRLLFLWGTGPLILSDFKIGETDLFDSSGNSNFGEDLEIEHLNGGEEVISFTSSAITPTQRPITIANNYKDDMAIRFRTTNTLPDPLVVDQIYYIINAISTQFELTKIKGSSTDRITFIDGGTGTHTGYPTIALYPQDIFEKSLSINLLQVDNWVNRTSQPNTTEISVDITFPSGLVVVNDAGNRLDRSVMIQIQYAKSGTSPLIWEIGDSGHSVPQTDFQIVRPNRHIIWHPDSDSFISVNVGRNYKIGIHRNTGRLKLFIGEFQGSTVRTNIKIPSIPADYVPIAKFATGSESGVFAITGIRPSINPFSDPSDFLASALGSDGVRISSGVINKLEIIYTDRRGIAIRRTIRFPLPEIGQYDVRIRRITADTD
ncbi:hypothetical protein LCGC14_1450860, partial [marine sediment metagenome]